MTVPQRSLFCFGLGDTAQRLAAHCHAEDWAVCGTVRSVDKAETLSARGWDVRVFEGTGQVVPPENSDWLISIPPGEQGCRAFAAAGELAATARSIIYLSTTGVYGDLGGRWAFEWSEVRPTSKRGERRVMAEQQWLSTGARVSLVRLPGIYGPGRSALDRVRDGTARRVIKPGHVFSRVHVEDIATGLAALLANPHSDGVFHLTDDEPAPPQDVIAEAARLLGRAVPSDVPIELAQLSAMALSFYAECKRVSNARAKAALGWRPQYPTYRDGLASILAAEMSQ